MAGLHGEVKDVPGLLGILMECAVTQVSVSIFTLALVIISAPYLHFPCDLSSCLIHTM